MANRAYKFRMYPNDEQKILFARTFGCVRMVYNHWLDRKIRQYEENKVKLIPAAKTIGPINSKANADKSFIFI